MSFKDVDFSINVTVTQEFLEQCTEAGRKAVIKNKKLGLPYKMHWNEIKEALRELKLDISPYAGHIETARVKAYVRAPNKVTKDVLADANNSKSITQDNSITYCKNNLKYAYQTYVYNLKVEDSAPFEVKSLYTYCEVLQPKDINKPLVLIDDLYDKPYCLAKDSSKNFQGKQKREKNKNKRNDTKMFKAAFEDSLVKIKEAWDKKFGNNT